MTRAHSANHLDSLDPAALRREALNLLDSHWDDSRGFCVPNPKTYPHLWLWDSCFHAIAWANLNDPRAHRELAAVLEGQLPDGMVPHMRYGPAGPDTWLGPLEQTSSITQPPMYGHAIRALADRGKPPADDVIDRGRRGLDWLWEHRRTEDDLLFIVHPWEAGNDHSPRYDDWGAPGRTPQDYHRAARTAWNKERMRDVTFNDDGAAVWSSAFVSCPAGFNAYAAFNMAELAHVTGDPELAERARRVSRALDTHLWDEQRGLWSDRAIVGGGESVAVPISDGVMGALVTEDPSRATAALAKLTDPEIFASRFGPSNVARSHPSYDPRAYWRGPAWPQLNYLLWVALRRWGMAEEAHALAVTSAATATANGWAEYWDPETGDGLGAAPQSWTTLAVAMLPAEDTAN
ncbi:trehalase family glycosidase [Streptomyces sp. NPDC006475]|uniref:MGH1-like glycoside hydrolase domain-containing protein n=1 Tax=Streptomyces sp. NPDC006475 TaxID=3155719 RepID=UPI0033B18150